MTTELESLRAQLAAAEARVAEARGLIENQAAHCKDYCDCDLCGWRSRLVDRAEKAEAERDEWRKSARTRFREGADYIEKLGVAEAELDDAKKLALQRWELLTEARRGLADAEAALAASVRREDVVRWLRLTAKELGDDRGYLASAVDDIASMLMDVDGREGMWRSDYRRLEGDLPTNDARPTGKETGE